MLFKSGSPSSLRSTVPVPEALAGYQIEVASAADYDTLLTGGVR